MNTHYDIEIWPNTAKVKKILFYMAGITILAWIAHFAGNFFWDDYSYEVTKASTGVTGRAGWPVTLYWWGIYIGVLGPVALIMVYLMQDRKNPVLALNKAGLFINQQMIKQTWVEWANISKIEKVKKEGTTSLVIYFVDASKIIEKQAGAKKAFLKENLKDGKPLICDNRFSTGDFDAFCIKANAWLNM